MNNFTLITPTKYIFGKDAQHKAGAMTAEQLGKKVLIVYGGGSAVRSGLLQTITNSLKEAGICYAELGGVQPNPTDSLVRKGIDICRQDGMTGILAVGGGSVIDTAKAIAIGTPYEGDFWDFFTGRHSPEKALPIGVILTIPAAGSEGSGNTVITLEKEKKKLSLRTESLLRPKFALINPELTYTLPPYQTACGIVDMMAHILERYFTPTRGVSVTDRISEGLLCAIMEEAPKVWENPTDYDARANIMWAGTLAHNGICGTGKQEDWASHFMEHEVSALYDVAHGAGLAVIIPAYMTYVARHKPYRIAMWARNVMGIHHDDDQQAAAEGISALKSFFSSLGMPVSFAELGIERPDIELLVKNLHANKGETLGSYYPLSQSDTAKIFRLAL